MSQDSNQDQEISKPQEIDQLTKDLNSKLEYIPNKLIEFKNMNLADNESFILKKRTRLTNAELIAMAGEIKVQPVKPTKKKERIANVAGYVVLEKGFAICYMQATGTGAFGKELKSKFIYPIADQGEYEEISFQCGFCNKNVPGADMRLCTHNILNGKTSDDKDILIFEKHSFRCKVCGYNLSMANKDTHRIYTCANTFTIEEMDQVAQ